MAKIHLNIEADTASDLHETLMDMLAGYDGQTKTSGGTIPAGVETPARMASNPVPPETGAPEGPPGDEADEPATGTQRDTNGVPWSADVHASNGATNADGTWRKRRGVDDKKKAEYEAPYLQAANDDTDDRPYKIRDGEGNVLTSAGSNAGAIQTYVNFAQKCATADELDYFVKANADLRLQVVNEGADPEDMDAPVADILAKFKAEENAAEPEQPAGDSDSLREECRQALRKLSAEKGINHAKEVLNKFDAVQIKQIDDKDLPNFLDAIKAAHDG